MTDHQHAHDHPAVMAVCEAGLDLARRIEAVPAKLRPQATVAALVATVAAVVDANDRVALEQLAALTVRYLDDAATCSPLWSAAMARRN